MARSPFTGQRGAPSAGRGFTLIEMIIAITLIGLLSVAAAPMLRLPLAAWMDASRRAALTNALDVADARLRDDLLRSVPNSVRIINVGPRVLLETLEVNAWGRHRAGAGGAVVCPAACASANDALATGCAAERCFTSIGPLQGGPAAIGNWLVVNPRAPNAGAGAGDPYFGGSVEVAGGIKSRITALAPAGAGQRLDFNPLNIPSLAANNRFYLASTPVTWDCDPATQTLTRRWGYAISAVQPVAFAGGNNAVLITRVTACNMVYTATAPVGPIAPRGGQVQLRVQMTALDNIGVPELTMLNASYAVSEDR